MPKNVVKNRNSVLNSMKNWIGEIINLNTKTISIEYEYSLPKKSVLGSKYVLNSIGNLIGENCVHLVSSGKKFIEKI